MKALPEFISYLSQARFTDKASLESLLASILMNPQSYYDEDTPSYTDETQTIAADFTKKMEEKTHINISADYGNPEIEENSIAYHRVFGPIIADDSWRWYFSTKRYIENIKAAEANPQINAHFVHGSTGGGEAWLLDAAFEALRDAKKPKIFLGEKVVASAGLFIAAPADKIYTINKFDTWGSLGTMIYFLDIIPYYLKMGIKEVEEYATKSDLKNKKFNDLKKGGKDAQNYIKSELDPLQEDFEASVRSVRPIIAGLPENHPVVRGETYATKEAIEYGLVDELSTLENAIQDCYNRGMKWKGKQKAHNNAYNFL